MELLAGDRLGKYEVVGRLAAGGMAEVYLAKILGHAGFAKPVALKRMLPSLASEPGFRAMFMQEAAMAARLNHPHVIQIFDFAEERGELYLAMEFVHGVNLRKLHVDALARRAADATLRLPPLLAAHIARCVARALSYAWNVPDERGSPLQLIHRDVSPHNVLLSHHGDVKLADFGIAKPAGLQTSAGVLKGKLRYMAPEQFAGAALDGRTDVFALGIVLYETALGCPEGLFDAPREAGTRDAVCKRCIPIPTRMEPDFPPLLSAVIMKALEREPSKRFQSAAEMADALDESLHREAKGPREYDLAAYMRRLYGEPPPIRGFSSARPSVAAVPASELDRLGDDGSASTVPRGEAGSPQPAAEPVPSAPPMASGGSGRSTVRERRRDVLAAQAVAERPAAAAAARRTQRLTSRALGALVVLGLLSVAGLVAAGVTAARSRSAAPARLEAGQPVVQPLSRADASREEVAGVPAAEIPFAGPAPDPAPDPALTAAPDASVRAEPAAAPRDAVAVAPVSRPDAGARPARPVTRPAKGHGRLVVHVKPWANVWLDSEPFTGAPQQEAAPRLVRKVPAGRHLVHLRDGAGRTRDIEVAIQPDRETAIEGDLSSLTVH